MSNRTGIEKVVVGAVVAAALTLASLSGGAVHADGGASKSPNATLAPQAAAPAGGVDGRDFLVWQRGGSASDERPTEEVAFYYN